jgi:hypothetical protein
LRRNTSNLGRSSQPFVTGSGLFSYASRRDTAAGGVPFTDSLSAA